MPVYQPCTGASQSRRYLSGLQCATGNDAAFREWGDELQRNLLLAGLARVDDTGQVDWTTVTWPGVNTTAAGYSMWRFSDTHQSDAPIYFKLEFGRGSNASTPAMWITVGTGTDGAGTITGEFFPRQRIDPNQNIAGGILGYPAWTYITVLDGFFGFAWKVDPNAGATAITDILRAGVFICRTTDATGNATETGATMLTHSAGGGGQLFQITRRFVTPATTYGPYDTNGSLVLSQGWPNYPVQSGLRPDIVTNRVGGSSRRYQDDEGSAIMQLGVYPIWAMFPNVIALSQLCAVIPADFPIGNTFYAAVKGQRRRRFISVGGRPGTVIANTFTVPVLAMLWE